MRYTHDERKRTANLKKHGLDFADAPAVIESDAASPLKIDASITASSALSRWEFCAKTWW